MNNIPRFYVTHWDCFLNKIDILYTCIILSEKVVYHSSGKFNVFLYIFLGKCEKTHYAICAMQLCNKQLMKKILILTDFTMQKSNNNSVLYIRLYCTSYFTKKKKNVYGIINKPCYEYQGLAMLNSIVS